MELNIRQNTALEMCSETIVKEIGSMKYFNEEEAIFKCNLIIKEFLRRLVFEHADVTEREYNKLLEVQRNNKVGSKEYVEIGLRMSTLKRQKALSNQLVNNYKRDDKLARLTEIHNDFVESMKHKYGDAVLDLLKKNSEIGL